MKSEKLFALALTVLLIAVANAKLLHLNSTESDPYVSALSNAQSNIGNQLSEAIEKLRFINDTLAQAYPNQTVPFELTVPAILNETSSINSKTLSPIIQSNPNCINLTKE